MGYMAAANEVRPLLHQIRHAKTEEELRELWDTVKERIPTSQTFIDYMEKQWINDQKLPRWAPLYQDNHQHIDTNNLVERWHRTLKHNYMEGRRNLRADDLIYILQGVVDIQFRTEYYKATNRFDVHRLSDYEKRQKAKATAVDPEFAMTLIDITGAANGAIFVRSFENRSNVDPYAVNVNADIWLNSCTCPDYQQRMVPCKHMFLVAMIYPMFSIKFGEDSIVQDGENNDENDFGPPMEDLISPKLLQQLKAARAKEEEERMEAAGEGKDSTDGRV
ncbi:hypothetical protein BGZ51_009708 [Haplosporangium sp. Z 767]|nr:hypothetical protein BGZ51_009708 [Haplosporangium sp. Z 767]KAF9194074.1 hypothetical protein BGZ50_006739 [Haplosporangium sp. Z 11]